MHTYTMRSMQKVNVVIRSDHVGDQMRIVRKKINFEKRFTPNWTEEVFTIDEVKDTKAHTLYIGRVDQGKFL